MIQKYRSMDVENKAILHALSSMAMIVVGPVVAVAVGLSAIAPVVVVFFMILLVFVLRREEKISIKSFSEREMTNSADAISARMKADKELAELRVTQMWDDAFEWLTAMDDYHWYSQRSLTHFGCEGRDCGQYTDLCYKCSNSVDHMVVSSSYAWVSGNNRRTAIAERYANTGSADVGIPAPWEESNEITKQLVR